MARGITLRGSSKSHFTFTLCPPLQALDLMPSWARHLRTAVPWAAVRCVLRPKAACIYLGSKLGGKNHSTLYNHSSSHAQMCQTQGSYQRKMATE